MGKENKYEGLWAGRTGWYSSKAFLKKDIADLLKEGERKKLILRYNKGYEKDSNRPRFIFAFADSSQADDITADVPYRCEDVDTEDEDTAEDCIHLEACKRIQEMAQVRRRGVSLCCSDCPRYVAWKHNAYIPLAEVEDLIYDCGGKIDPHGYFTPVPYGKYLGAIIEEAEDE